MDPQDGLEDCPSPFGATLTNQHRLGIYMRRNVLTYSSKG